MYAANTSVPVDRSKAEIERTLERYGADQFAYAIRGDAAMVEFVMKGKRIRFVIPLPEKPDAGAARYSTCRAISLATGWLVGLVEALGFACEYYTPRDVKFAAAGSAVASKSEVMRAMAAKHPLIATIRYAADREHVADAAGAFEAARNGQTVRMLEQGARAEADGCHVPECAGKCQGGER